MRNRILFADSSATLQRVVEMAFENEDISVTMTASGEEALSMLEEITPDLIIADEELPELSGVELCKKVKESGLYSLIPFLMLRKDDEILEDDTPEGQGPDAVLLKPFKSEELVNKVKELISVSDNYTDNFPDVSNSAEDDLQTAEDEEAQNILSTPESSEEFEQLIQNASSEEDILAGLDEEEELSLQEEEELISLTSEKELSPGEDGSLGQPPELEISSTEEDIPEEEINLSGLLSEEDILAGVEAIEKRDRELDEIFGIDNELEEEESPQNDASDETEPVEFFKEKSPPSPADHDLPEPELEAIVTSSLKKSLENIEVINETIVREELKEYLNTLTPDLMKAIEKAIWDIMPDLAESLLKKEIEKIKNG